MDGCPRQNPAYRLANESPASAGLSIFRSHTRARGASFDGDPAAGLLTIATRSRPEAAHGALRPGVTLSPPPTHMFHHQRPQAAGLNDPAFDHDACGIGPVARLDNRREHEVVERAIQV